MVGNLISAASTRTSPDVARRCMELNCNDCCHACASGKGLAVETAGFAVVGRNTVTRCHIHGLFNAVPNRFDVRISRRDGSGIHSASHSDGDLSQVRWCSSVQYGRQPVQHGLSMPAIPMNRRKQQVRLVTILCFRHGDAKIGQWQRDLRVRNAVVNSGFVVSASLSISFCSACRKCLNAFYEITVQWVKRPAAVGDHQ